MTLLSQIKKEENEFLLPSCRGLLLHALKVPKVFESVLSILSNKMDVLVPEEEVCSVRARSARIPFYHSLENRSNTSISFVRTYEITHNNSPFVKTLELHKKTQLALEHRYRIRSMMLYAVFRFGTFTERSVHLYSRGVDRKFI